MVGVVGCTTTGLGGGGGGGAVVTHPASKSRLIAVVSATGFRFTVFPPVVARTNAVRPYLREE